MTDAGGRCISDFQYAWEMKGVLLIAPLDDDISKSTAAERRLLDFSGGLFFHVGYLFCTDWSKKVCSISYHDSLCRIPERTDSFWPIKVSPCFNFETRPWFLLQGSDVFCFSACNKKHDDDVEGIRPNRERGSRKRTSARTKMSSQLWYRLDMWCTRIPNQ